MSEHVVQHLDRDPNDPRNAVPAQPGISVEEALELEEAKKPKRSASGKFVKG